MESNVLNQTTNLSNVILDYLIQKLTANPNFKFWLRKRNSKNRLDDGYWFNGNENYIHIGFTKLGAGNLSTQSIGFVVWFDGNSKPQGKIEIVFRNEKDQKTKDCYNQIATKIGGFNKTSDTSFHRDYKSATVYDALDEFLTVQKPIIDSEIIAFGLEDKMNIPKDVFDKSLKKILKKREEIKAKSKLKLIIANITWNSKDWKEISEDASGHAWVGGDTNNIPHESWNFDIDNARNPEDKVYGFAKFTNPPKVEGTNNLIIFYSQGKIVGFYAKAEILKEWGSINEQESYNLIGEKNLSLVLPNKIENIKEKGYLEGLERVGQVGFSYLKEEDNVLNILDEAIALNQEQASTLEKIQDWVISQSSIKEKFEKWLKDNGRDSGKISSYLRAINILIEHFKVKVYTESNVDVLTILHEDLKQHQKEENGKYYYEKAKSYGTGGFYSAAIGEYIEFLKQQGNTNRKSDTDTKLDMEKAIDVNQIFFGPPGTGKTYHTINEAIKIVDPKFYEEHKNNRDQLKERFKLLLLNNDNEDVGQIGFTTFHQSFSYEDFIEGIKPVEPKQDDTFLKYEIQEGIFKKLCRIANDSINAVAIDADSLISLSSEDYDKAHFYKMSLGNTQNEEDNEVYDYCIQNNCITIGFGNGLDFTDKDEKELRVFGQENQLETFPINAMNLFCNYLKVGNYVVISNGNNYIRAIGKVVGDYEYVEDSPFPNNADWKHFRKVEWIFTDKHISAKEVYNKNLQQQTIYKLEKKEVKKDFFVKDKIVDTLKLPKNPKNFVLIVDEINRGNVSSIFGELITLIEKDKRAGTDEELSVILPYSKTKFKVPQNVYIVGTMNTADRSIEALDTALRRRFSFKEMPPKASLILSEGKLKESQGNIGDIDVVKILETINNRIEKLIDKDHKIGHAYFMDIENESELKSAFNNKVIPLLEEYFFGDFGKISLVLGSSFISQGTKSEVTFAKNNDYDASIAADLLERLVYEITSQDQWDFKAIYE
ncbi:AAA family ATPase [Cellulophaga sp. E16_2]|uniref:AAA family ATPase n=1 Tax=Cellulophaga sp. E16_2 TaxID=2789297 RepID=UPI002103CBE7|nr:AAA family ATPase [Cellulophaga sp. E16_2]MBO0593125.1 AAA family ATPase [Cellulophaga sp. E16_2]